MNIEEILEALVCPEMFPEDVIAEAIARRDELSPVFIAKLGEWAEKRGYPKSGYYYLSSFAFYLLGEWRETSAFKPLLRFIATPQADHLLGDDITNDGGLLLSRLYDGDHAALESLVLDEKVDEFVRDAALDCYVRLAQDGIVPREQVRAFVERLLAELPRESGFIWIAVVNAISSLGWRDLTPEVTRLFETGLADRVFMEFKDFAGDLDKAERGEFFNRRHDGDLVDRMRSWRYAQEVREADEKVRLRRGQKLTDEERELYAVLHDDTPAVNEYRNVGRNDPCPCGSGKKFKKCCLPKVEAGEI